MMYPPQLDDDAERLIPWFILAMIAAIVGMAAIQGPDKQAKGDKDALGVLDDCRYGGGVDADGGGDNVGR